MEPNDSLKFATYTRDAATGLDYADQRYYASNFGRFMSPDPYRATATSPSRPSDPLSWNRYSYTRGDPINYGDPRGTQLVYVGKDVCAVGAGEGTEDTECDDYEESGGGSGSGRGGGGAGSPPGIKLTPGQTAQFAEALGLALDALDSKDCASIFNTSGTGTLTPQQVLQSMAFWGGLTSVPDPGFFKGDIIFAPLGADRAAQMEEGGGMYINDNWVYTTGSIVINSSASAGYFFSASPVEDALTLLHELGHFFAQVAGMGGSKIIYDANSDGSPNDEKEAKNAATLQPCANAALEALLKNN
jgi:RHS repeat-associated protein